MADKIFYGNDFIIFDVSGKLKVMFVSDERIEDLQTVGAFKNGYSIYKTNNDEFFDIQQKFSSVYINNIERAFKLQTADYIVVKKDDKDNDNSYFIVDNSGKKKSIKENQYNLLLGAYDKYSKKENQIYKNIAEMIEIMELEHVPSIYDENVWEIEKDQGDALKTSISYTNRNITYLSQFNTTTNRPEIIALKTVFDNRVDDTFGYTILKNDSNNQLYFRNQKSNRLLLIDSFKKLNAERSICSYTDSEGKKKIFYTNHLGDVGVVSEKSLKQMESWHRVFNMNYQNQIQENIDSQKETINSVVDEIEFIPWL